MLFPEFGEYGIPALQLGFELLDLAIFGLLGDLGLAAAVEGGMAVLEELLEPAVDLGGGPIELIAPVRDGNFLDQMLFEDGDFFRPLEMPTLLDTHDQPPLGLS